MEARFRIGDRVRLPDGVTGHVRQVVCEDDRVSYTVDTGRGFVTAAQSDLRRAKPLAKPKSKFQVGDRVRLAGDEEEGIPEETGTVTEVQGDEYPGMYIVEIDPEYLTDRHDDGIREVHEDQMALE